MAEIIIGFFFVFRDKPRAFHGRLSRKPAEETRSVCFICRRFVGPTPPKSSWLEPEGLPYSVPVQEDSRSRTGDNLYLYIFWTGRDLDPLLWGEAQEAL